MLTVMIKQTLQYIYLYWKYKTLDPNDRPPLGDAFDLLPLVFVAFLWLLFWGVVFILLFFATGGGKP